MACKFKDALGKPGEGIHSLRIPIPGLKNGIALADTLATLIVAYLIGKYYNLSKCEIVIEFIKLVIVGEIAHVIFCVKTPLSSLLCSK